MKTSELTGAALDWAVHVALGSSMASCDYWLEKYEDEDRRSMCETYSTDWAQGGPLIEREKISLSAWGLVNWKAITLRYPQEIEVEHSQFGETPLIAAMRCYVASKLGNEVEIPEELAYAETSAA